jgi:hypothetical protein
MGRCVAGSEASSGDRQLNSSDKVADWGDKKILALSAAVNLAAAERVPSLNFIKYDKLCRRRSSEKSPSAVQ